MVYFIRMVGHPHYIKIGTTTCLEVRLDTLRVEYGAEPEVLAVVQGDREVEAKLHRRFAHLREPGRGRPSEWFRVEKDLLDFIARKGAPWDGSRWRRKVMALAPVVAKAKRVAEARGIDLYAYIDAVLLPAVERDYRRLFDKNGEPRKQRKPAG